MRMIKIIVTAIAISISNSAVAVDVAVPTDAGFGANEMVSTEFSLRGDLVGTPNGMCVQPNGKIIVVGYAATTVDPIHQYFAVARYNTDGTLDTGFTDGDLDSRLDISNTPGIVITNFQRNLIEYAKKCIVHPTGGKIIVVGVFNTTGNKKRIAVARYKSNGHRDATFSGDGLEGIAAYNPNIDIWANDVALMPDGRIVIAGGAKSVSGRQGVAVARLKAGECNADSCLDDEFGEGGIDMNSVVPDGSWQEEANSVSVVSDGLIIGGDAVIGGKKRFLAAKFTIGNCEEGNCLVNSFGTRGLVVSEPSETGNNESISSIAIRPDGKILAAGTSRISGASSKFAFRCYNSNGAGDLSFGTGNFASADFAPLLELSISDVAFFGEKMVAAGIVGHSQDSQSILETALVSLNFDGSPDETIGEGGHVVSSYPKGAVGLAVQPDGRIIAAGMNKSGNGFGLRRFAGFYTPPAGEGGEGGGGGENGGGDGGEGARGDGVAPQHGPPAGGDAAPIPDPEFHPRNEFSDSGCSLSAGAKNMSAAWTLIIAVFILVTAPVAVFQFRKRDFRGRLK